LRGIDNGGATGIFDGDERLKALLAAGDPFERLLRIIDFEVFWVDLEAALSRSDQAKGGRPPHDAVSRAAMLPEPACGRGSSPSSPRENGDLGSSFAPSAWHAPA
jgi:hypothetical protein